MRAAHEEISARELMMASGASALATLVSRNLRAINRRLSQSPMLSIFLPVVGLPRHPLRKANAGYQPWR